MDAFKKRTRRIAHTDADMTSVADNSDYTKMTNVKGKRERLEEELANRKRFDYINKKYVK